MNYTPKTKNFFLPAILLIILLFLNFGFKRFLAFAQEIDIPNILPRSSWDNTEELHKLLFWIPNRQNTAPPDYAKVERIVIHDLGCSLESPTCNNDSVDPISLIKNIYRFHSQSRGWGDIGYNFIIDRKGNIYEGRFGGNGVRGAHTYYDRKCMNFNVGTVGIVLAGNYSQQDMSEVMYQSLAKLVGWISATNNLEPLEMAKTALVWKNPRLEKGGCDTSTGSFASIFTAPVVVGHGDVEDGNSDPGLVDLKKVRQNSMVYYNEYKNSIFKSETDNLYWLIENGTRRGFSSLQEAESAGYKNYRIGNISKSMLEFFPLYSAFKYPDGTLLRVKDSPTIYLIENGTKRPLSVKPEEFIKLGFDWDDVIVISHLDLENYPASFLIKYGPDNSLIKGDDPTIYYIENGRKRRITSLRLFLRLGLSWDKVKTLPQSEISLILDGMAMTYPEGTLIRASDGAVHLVKEGRKHTFSSEQLFKHLGYKWEDVVAVSDEEVALIPQGKPMIYAEETLIRTKDKNEVYVVKNGELHWISSNILLKKMGYNLKNLVKISQDEFNNYKIGSELKYPDGTVVKTAKNSPIYLISDGKLHKFTSQIQFKKLGYKAANIVTLSSREVSLYPQGEDVKYKDGTLLQAKGDMTVYVLEKGTRKPISSEAEFKKAGYKWKDVILIPRAELEKYPIFGVVALPAPSTPSNSTTVSNVNNEKLGKGDLIRVAIYSIATPDSTVQISASGPFQQKIYDAAGNLLSTNNKPASQIVSIPFFTSGYQRFEGATGDVIMKIVSYSDISSWDSSFNDNEFRGAIELRYSPKLAKLWIINELPLEDYVKGLAEISNSDEIEYIKVIATAARTYGKYYVERGGKYSDEPFHLKNSRKGNGSDQVYRGYNFERRASKLVQAVNETSGEIVTYKGKSIVAAYSSDSGGITKSGCEALSKTYCSADYAYLAGGVKDPETTIHNPSIVAASHGAGISAVGARQMIKQGKTHKEVLEYYYPGVKVEKIY